jgi:hypothetical protein
LAEEFGADTMNAALPRLSRILANIPATAIMYDGRQLEAWMNETPKDRDREPKPKKTRRTSIKRLVRELRATGERVVVEQDKDGTTRVMCEEPNETPAANDYWDRKLK